MYQRMMLSGNWNPSNIIKYFKGADYIKAGVKHVGTGNSSTYGMRKTEALEIMRNLKRTNAEVAAFDARNADSDMYKHSGLREKLHREALKTARTESLYTSNRPSAIKARDAGKIPGTVRDMRGRVYKFHDQDSDYVEFYPED